MRKVLILFLAVSLFASCKDKKTDSRDDRRSERDRDDYRTRDDDRDNDKRETDYKDDRDSRDKDEYKDTDDNNSGGGWSSAEVKVFVDNCAPEAEKNGLTFRQATDYCECMQRGLEKMYPNANDVGNIDMESPRIKRMVEDCAPRN